MWWESKPQWDLRVTNWATDSITRATRHNGEDLLPSQLAEEVMENIEKLKVQAQDDIHF